MVKLKKLHLSHACCSKKQLQITGSVYLLDWTTGLDYCSHPNCRKIPCSRQDRSLFTQLLCYNCSIACVCIVSFLERSKVTYINNKLQ